MANGGAERREHERHAINEEKFLLLDGARILIEDISFGGLKGDCPTAHEGRVKIAASSGGHEIEAKVVGCTELGARAMNPDYPFQVRCQFLSPPSDPDVVGLVEFVLE